MPEISGIDLLRRLKELKVGMPVIVITGHGDVQLAVEAMKIGAADFLEKPFDDERAARRRQVGARPLGEGCPARDRARRPARQARHPVEPRARGAGGAGRGKANKIIAFDLGISPRTVEIYRANVMTKMNAGSLSELVRMALLAGLLKSASDK